MYTKITPVAAAVLLTSFANGHVILENPKPYKFPAYGPSNPLEPNGSDWPCKIPAGVTKLEIDDVPTVMATGEQQTASFTGLAVHGGGSCQFALLPGFEPSKMNDDFRVIKSIEGGCPVKNIKGNLDSGKPDTFPYTIPSTVAAGNYTWSWTWFSRTTGEFYMNCAPITVIPGKQAQGRDGRPTPTTSLNKRALKDLPPLFMANLGNITGTCTTDKTPQQAIQFPDPGTDVDHPEGTDKLIKQVCNGNPKAGSGSRSSTVFKTSSASASSSAVPTAPKPNTLASSSHKLPSTLSIACKNTTSSATYKPSSTSTATASREPTGVAPTIPFNYTTSEGECTEGHLLCVDRTKFSTCTGGKWTTPQPLAANTHCEGGAGTGLTVINTN